MAGEVVAIGPFWRGGDDEIDAVVLRGRSRRAALVGEAKWAKEVDARDIEPRLSREVASLPKVVDNVRLAVCARRRVRYASTSTLTVTTDDIFT